MLIRTNSVISGNMVGILSEYVVLNKVEDSDEKYKCKEMSACPYTGTTIINKIDWGWVWSPQEADQEGGGMMEVRYDVVRDRYVTTNTKVPEREGWWRRVWR